MNIGDKIKFFRKKAGLTQLELALKANISRSYLADVENNRYNPSIEFLKSVANALCVPIGEFFKTEKTESEPNTPPTLKAKDIKEIEEVLKQTEEQLLSAEGLMFDGKPASPETIQKILDAMRIGMELAKKEAKEKYTPKKYRK